MKNIFLIIITVLFLGCSNEETTVEKKTVYNNSKEHALLRAINETRSLHNLNSLTMNSMASYYAIEHYNRLLETGEVNHNFFYTRAQHIIDEAPAEDVGEIIAVGYYNTESTINAWLNSSSHREALLDGRYNEVGIARRRNLEDNNLTVVIFIRK